MIPLRLKLAVLGQAVLDALVDEDLEDESALTLLGTHYPQLLKKLSKMTPQERRRWYDQIERAMGR